MKTSQLKNDVEQELRFDPSVRAEQIGVSVRNGVVASLSYHLQD